MAESLSAKRSVHPEIEGGGPLCSLHSNRQLPGTDVQAVCLSDRPLKRSGELSDGLRARQKSRSGTSGPHAGRCAGQRFAEILRAALDLVSDLETSDSADETSSGGTLSAISASSADFARVMGMLELSSEDDDLYHDRFCAPHALSPVKPDCSEVSKWSCTWKTPRGT